MSDTFSKDGYQNRKEMNTLFPVFFKLEKLKLLLVGGGNVALEKLTAIFSNSPQAQVRLVGKEISLECKKFLEENHVPFHERPFEPNDLQGIDLAIIAINEKDKSAEIQGICKQAGVLVNVADTPDYCDFYLGSVVQKGNLKIAISTNGKSPTIAKRVKETLNEVFPDEIDKVLDNMQKIRNSLTGDFSDKVRKLNDITAVLSSKPNNEKRNRRLQTILYFLVGANLAFFIYFLLSTIF